MTQRQLLKGVRILRDGLRFGPLLVALIMVPVRVVTQEDNAKKEETPKTAEKPEKKEAKKFTHRVQAVIGITDKFGDLSGSNGTCDLTVHVKDPGGIGDEDKGPVKIGPIQISSTAGDHQGKSDEETIDSDKACHKEDQLNAWPTKVTCQFGANKKFELALDPNQVPGAKGKTPKPAGAHWFEPIGKDTSQNYPSEKYTPSAGGPEKQAPQRTGKNHFYRGNAPVEGGSGNGDVTVGITIFKSGRACARDEK